MMIKENISEKLIDFLRSYSNKGFTFILYINRTKEKIIEIEVSKGVRSYGFYVVRTIKDIDVIVDNINLEEV